MKVVSTVGWPFEQVAEYGREITAAFQKLAARYSADVTAKGLLDKCLSGQKQLWLVLDDEDNFVAMAMTCITTVETTGVRIATLSDLSGSDIDQFWEELGDALEAWAREQGADWTAVEGRPGWQRLMKQRGYGEHARSWRKRID